MAASSAVSPASGYRGQSRQFEHPKPIEVVGIVLQDQLPLFLNPFLFLICFCFVSALMSDLMRP